MTTHARGPSERIDTYLSQFELREDVWFEKWLRPYDWPEGAIGVPRHVQIARQFVRLLNSLAKARDRGHMDDPQAARYKEVLLRFRKFWPLVAEEVKVPQRLVAQLDGNNAA